MNSKITLTLQYLDFFECDFESNNVYQFRSKNLNTPVRQSFFNNPGNPNTVNLGFYCNVELGSFSLSINKEKNLSKTDGIGTQTNITSSSINSDTKLIKDWIDKSHEFCSQLFKGMTKGKFYQSFNQIKE